MTLRPRRVSDAGGGGAGASGVTALRPPALPRRLFILPDMSPRALHLPLEVDLVVFLAYIVTFLRYYSALCVLISTRFCACLMTLVSLAFTTMSLLSYYSFYLRTLLFSYRVYSLAFLATLLSFI